MSEAVEGGKKETMTHSLLAFISFALVAQRVKLVGHD